jgi:type IV pilus assembly protein PilF
VCQAAAVLLLAALAAGCSQNQQAAQKDAQASYKLGVAFLTEGRPGPALRELTTAEALAPDDPEILNALAIAYWQRRDLGLAEQKFKKAVAVKPDYSEAWNNLGAMYMDQGRFADAVPVLQNALKNLLYGTQERALTNLGLCLVKLGRMREAERRFREAIEVAPRFPLARKHLGMLLKERGDCAEALTQLDEAARTLPEDAEIQLNRGLCLLSLGKRPSAREAFQRAWQLAPGNEVGRLAKTYVERLE